MIFAWVDILTVLLTTALLYRLGGGKLSYPIALIGFMSIIGFIIAVFGGPQVIWLSILLKSTTMFVAALWFVEILRP